MLDLDVIVIGAGAAGMMCAAQAGQGGLRVGLIDHSSKLAEKIRISGGGRCNFTNRQVDVSNFASERPEFARFALAGFQPADFLRMVEQHGIAYHEKHKGQLFCNHSSEDIIQMLSEHCRAGRVQWFKPHSVQEISSASGRYLLQTTAGTMRCKALVVATGGLPVPKIGASDFGLHVAKQFGHKLVDTRPALVPLTFQATDWAPFADLAGLALPVFSRGSEPNAPWFDEDLLFTHRGLSGPAMLQASTYWQPGQSIHLNLYGRDVPAAKAQADLQAASTGSKAQLENWLAQQLAHWPKRLLQSWMKHPQLAALAGRKVAELGKKQLQPLAQLLVDWQLVPSGTEGYRKAEVMRGGVSTAQLNSKTMESLQSPGLYFIGEVVDVTGWLGGYNFQWAWASGVAAARAILQQNT